MDFLTLSIGKTIHSKNVLYKRTNVTELDNKITEIEKTVNNINEYGKQKYKGVSKLSLFPKKDEVRGEVSFFALNEDTSYENVAHALTLTRKYKDVELIVAVAGSRKEHAVG